MVVADLEVGGERGRVINPIGIATAITATEYKDSQKVIVEAKNEAAISVVTEDKDVWQTR